MTAERCWAAAMAMKSIQSNQSTQKSKVKSVMKRQIITKLKKATQYASHLVGCLKDTEASRATTGDVMEASAYLAALQGALQFEKFKWRSCIQKYSIARVIYAALGGESQGEMFKDLLSNTIDPSIQYAAYHSKIPRTKNVSDVAIENFTSKDIELREMIESVDSTAFKTSQKAGVQGDIEPDDVPSTVDWRQRSVKIEDAGIAQAIAIANHKERGLSEIGANSDVRKRELAAAYDEVIIAWQQAVDATKSALGELIKEGVAMSDHRVQSLELTRTAVTYAVITLRIGRSWVLCGDYKKTTSNRAKWKPSHTRKKHSGNTGFGQSKSTRLAKMRERVGLYDSILQDIDEAKVLSGVARDSSFMEELAGKMAYFRALKCVSSSANALLSDI
jgi:signal recognition particle subunit SRP68